MFELSEDAREVERERLMTLVELISKKKLAKKKSHETKMDEKLDLTRKQARLEEKIKMLMNQSKTLQEHLKRAKDMDTLYWRARSIAYANELEDLVEKYNSLFQEKVTSPMSILKDL